MRSILAPALAGLLLLAAPAARAGNATWVGGTSTDYNNTANWNPAATLPTVNGDVPTVNSIPANICTITANPSFKPGDIFVGNGAGTTGRLDLRSGTVTQNVIGSTGNWVFIGNNSTTANGTFNIGDTSVTGQPGLTTFGQGSGNFTAGKLWIGSSSSGSAGGTGTVNINTTGLVDLQSTASGVACSISLGSYGTSPSGTLNLENGGLHAAGEVWVAGTVSSGTGTINQSGGSFTNNSWFGLGRTGTGVYNMTGGALYPATLNHLSLGSIGITSSGTLNLRGGTVNCVQDTYVGEGGIGVLNISGSGTFVSGSSIWTYIGKNSGSSGTINLDGGTFNVRHIELGSGAGKLNLNGGTLQVNSATDVLIKSTLTTYVKAGGAVIDTAGFDKTLGVALLTDSVSTGGGLTKNGAGSLTLSSGASTYTGNTTNTAGTLTLGASSTPSAAGSTVTSGPLGTGTLALNAGTLQNAGNISLANPITAAGGNITAVSATAWNVNGAISGSGALGLSAILGSSGLYLGGNNSGYTGTVTVSGPNVRLAAANASSASAKWVVNAGLQLDTLGAQTYNFGELSGSGGIAVHSTNTSTTVSTISVGALNTSSTFSGVLRDLPNNDAATGNKDTAANNQLALTKIGTGTLTLSGGNANTGPTSVSAGTLLVNGSLASGSTVTVNGSGSVLGGSGTIGGATMITSGGAVTPRPNGGTATTLTVGGNLTITNGASANFILSSSGTGSNDKINYGNSSTLTLDSSDTINITAAGGLDPINPYTLFSSSAGTVSMAAMPILKTNGVTCDQVTPGGYKLAVVGSSLVLQYISSSTPPTVNSASASVSSLVHNQTTTVTVNVTPAAGQTISSVTVTVDGLGGSGDPTTLTGPGGNGSGNWTGTFTVPADKAFNTYSINGTVLQSDSTTAAWTVNALTVSASSPVWNGGGGDANWSTGNNWGSGSPANIAPGTTGDSVTFSGSTQTSPNLENNYGVTGLTFDSSAASFNINSANGSALTLSGSVTNNSANPQTLTVATTLAAVQTFNTATGDVIFRGAISGTGGGINKTGNHTLTLSGTNTYTGSTTASAGTLQLQGAGALSSGSALTLSSGSTLSLQADADTTFAPGSLGAFSPGSTYNIQVNSLNSPAGNGHTFTLTGQGGASASGTTTINISSTTGDTLKFNTSAAYAIGGNSGSAWAGDTTAFNLTGANLVLNGLSQPNNNDCLVSLASASGNSLTINGTVTANNNRTMGAILNSGVLTLNNTVSANTGQPNWGFFVNLNGGILNVNNAGAIRNNHVPGFTITGGTLDNTSGTDLTLSGNPAMAFNGDFSFAGSYNLNLGTGGVSMNASRQITVSSNTLTIGGVISGSGFGLTKAGNGTLVLAGANTYTGNTIVNAGALRGTGTIAGPVTVNSGGTLATGTTNAIGSLTINNALTLSGTNNFRLNKTGATLTNDKILGTTSLTAGGTLIVSTNGGDALAAGDSFALFNTGMNSGWFTTVTAPTLAAGISWDTNNLATTGTLDVYTFTTTTLSISTLVNTAATVSAAKLAAHAASARGTPVATSTSTPGHGTATLSAGALTYTPASGYSGSDAFTVTFQDGHGVQTMAVNITVGTQNVGPQLTTVDAGGFGSFSGSGVPGTLYTVQISTNLSDAPPFNDYLSVTSAPNGVINFTDPTSIADHGNQVYYRLKQYVAP